MFDLEITITQGYIRRRNEASSQGSAMHTGGGGFGGGTSAIWGFDERDLALLPLLTWAGAVEKGPHGLMGKPF